jgi:tRNA-specific 2-thiouridylase
MKKYNMEFNDLHFKQYMLGNLTQKPNNYSITVGMSGGVDSSVVGALLSKSGFQIRGVTLKLNSSEISSCCSSSDAEDASAVAMKIGFPHVVLDYSSNFKQVLDDFVYEYSHGRTPSPCVRCNQKIKFGDLLDFTSKLGIDFIATGHYVLHKFAGDEVQLWRPKDRNKDQTYFMSLVTKDQMQRLRFPLGIYSKVEVRELATSLGLGVANKKDSQDLCFAQGNYQEVLAKMSLKMDRGLFIDVHGNILGHHEGIQHYTVGQRKRIDLPNGPWFVLKIIADENKIVIGRYEELQRNSFTVDSLNLTSEILDNVVVQVRARHTPVPCIIHRSTGEIELLETTYGVAPGQICAFYSGDRLIGGGRITA